MYCRKCGKFIDGDLDLCEECSKSEVKEEVVVENAEEKVEEAVVNATIAEVTPVLGGNKKKGLTLGIFGIIIGFIGLMVVSVAYGVYMGAVFAMNAATGNSTELRAAAEIFVDICPGLIVACWIGTAISAVGIVFGAVAMSTFFGYKKTTGVKAIPTLVTGIISLALGISSSCSGLLFVVAMQDGLNQILAVL